MSAYYLVKWFPAAECGKIVKLKAGIKSALEREGRNNKNKSREKTVTSNCNNERLTNSISRTKSRIYELAACNEWSWFFTGTLNPSWNDVENLSEFRRKLTQKIRDYRKKTGYNVKYLLVPERHKSGAWHIHGLLAGLPAEALHKFTENEKLPLKILKRVKKENDVYDWREYSKTFGFSTLTPVRSVAATAAYVTKYITKEVALMAQGTGSHLFYSSIGLQSAVVVAEGYDLPLETEVYDFENDYVAIKKITKEEMFMYGYDENDAYNAIKARDTAKKHREIFKQSYTYKDYSEACKASEIDAYNERDWETQKAFSAYQ